LPAEERSAIDDILTTGIICAFVKRQKFKRDADRFADTVIRLLFFTAYFLHKCRIPVSDICLCPSVCVCGKKAKSDQYKTICVCFKPGRFTENSESANCDSGKNISPGNLLNLDITAAGKEERRVSSFLISLPKNNHKDCKLT
jgi:hypothetical protein